MNPAMPAAQPAFPTAGASPSANSNALPVANSSSGSSSVSPSTLEFTQWSVQADPPQSTVNYSAARMQIPVPQGFHQWIAVPQTPSRFIAVRGSQGARTFITAWNLETLAGSRPLAAAGFAERCPIAVSPDGERIALVSDLAISEWSTETEKELKSGSIDAEVTGQLFEYLGPTEIVVAHEGYLAIYDTSGSRIRARPVATEADPKAQFALSPGGRYAAGFFPAQKRLVMYDLRESRSTGEISFLKEAGANRCYGLSFNPEGDELAIAISDQFSRLTLLNIDVARGQLLQRHATSLSWSGFSWNNGAPKQELQTLPDRRGWMLGAGILLGRDDGQVLWSAKARASSVDESRMPWKLLSVDRMLVVQGTQMTALTFKAGSFRPQDSSSSPSVDTLPDELSLEPLAELDRSTGSSTQVSEAVVPWQSISDPVSPGEPVVERLLAGVSDDRAWRMQVFPDRRRMLLSTTEPARLSNGTSITSATIARSRIIDLTTGDIVRELQPPLPSASIDARYPPIRLFTLVKNAEVPQCASISTDGRLAVSTTTSGLVLVWSLEDSREIVRFRVPDFVNRNYPRHPFVTFNAQGQLLLHELRDDGRTLTLSCQDVPSLKRVWEIFTTKETASYQGQQMRSVLGLSPNRRYAALDLHTTVRVIDTQTGAITGDLPLTVRRTPPDSPPDQALFSPDGRRLVAAFRSRRRTDLVAWDLESGQEVSSFSIDGMQSLTDWLNSDQILCTSASTFERESSVVDLMRHCIVWRLDGNQMPLLALGQGTFLSTHEIMTPDVRGIAAVRTLFPDAGIRREIEDRMPAPLPAVAGPGSQISIEFGALSGLESQQQQLTELLTNNLKENGMTVGRRDGVTLRVTLEALESQTDEYEFRFQPRLIDPWQPSRDSAPGRLSLTSRKYIARRQLVNPAGQTVWMEEQEMTDDPGFYFSFIQREGESVATAAQRGQSERLSEILQQWLRESLPRVIYPQPRFGEKNQPGLGRSEILSSRLNAIDTQGWFADWNVQSDRNFIAALKDSTSDQLARFAALDGDERMSRWRWSPGLRRALPGIRWGFGVQLAQPPKDNLIKIQSNRFQALDTLRVMTGGVAPQLVARLSGLNAEGALGEQPESPDVRTLQPVLLGGGGRRTLLEAAQSVGLDVLVLVQFAGTATAKKNDITMTIRFLNTDSGEEFFATEKVNAQTGAGTARDVASELVDVVLQAARDKLKFLPLDSASDTDIKDRFAQLEKNGSGLPQAAAVELLVWRDRQVINEARARLILKKLTTDSTVERGLFSDRPEERSEAVKRMRE